MGPIGIIGCLLSVIGAVIIIFHAPEDPDVQSVQELVAYMLKPGQKVWAVIQYVMLTVYRRFLDIWNSGNTGSYRDDLESSS